MQPTTVLPSSWLPDETTEQLRELERTRQRLTQQTTRLGNALWAGLVRHGQDCPYSDRLAKEATQWLDECQAQLPALVQISGQALRNSLAAIAEQVKVLATEVSQQSENNQQAALLRTIPGVGPLLSVAMVLAAQHFSRVKATKNMRTHSAVCCLIVKKAPIDSKTHP